jgi:hypothetical protein
MPILFSSNAQKLTYQRIADYLTSSDLFKDSVQAIPEQPRFRLFYGSTGVDMEVTAWEVNPWEIPDLVIVRAYSRVTRGSRIDAELLGYLLNENCRMRFGAFQVGEDGQIGFAHSILGGEGMDLRELQTCILSVVTIADTYDDLIRERFGGQRAMDG